MCMKIYVYIYEHVYLNITIYECVHMCLCVCLSMCVCMVCCFNLMTKQYRMFLVFGPSWFGDHPRDFKV